MVEQSTRDHNEEVFSGSIIDFQKIKLKILHKMCLETQLLSHGVDVENNLSQDEMLVQLNKISNYSIDSLHMCCVSGGGGYVDWQVSEPTYIFVTNKN